MNGPSGLSGVFRAVRKVLWEDWDPIGCGVPEDEYDDYVWPVVQLLREGAGRDALAGYLADAARGAMGCPVPDSRNLAVADKLMALGISN